MNHYDNYLWSILAVLLLVMVVLVPHATAKDISELTEHFNEPGADISPWVFVPEENIEEFSTTERRGLATLWEAGNGKDIKGILKDSININDYPLPWEFQLSMLQNGDAISGFGLKNQCNTAIGLNIAVTFSDPSTWPEDRTQMPPDTHSFQLLVAHLGATGEAQMGLPQYSTGSLPENFLVWGRGDLGHTVMGDWRIPYIWTGGGVQYEAGPASRTLFYRCAIYSPTSLSVGIRFKSDRNWFSRSIDCSKFGPITGIWEIGPIISCDRWIPDVLCRNLPQEKAPTAIGNLIGNNDENGRYTYKWDQVFAAPEPETPDPSLAYYVDYCVFTSMAPNPANPLPFEILSDDFDIEGYLGQWQFQNAYGETISKPGYLTFLLEGGTQGGCFNHMNPLEIDFKNYDPPLELETCFIAPDDSIPWNLHVNMFPYTKEAKSLGLWKPGIQNIPDEDRHEYRNLSCDILMRENVRQAFDVQFDPEVPESILSHKPLYMLIQILDKRHVRMGFKANKEDPWHLSKVTAINVPDGQEDVEVGKYLYAWSTLLGKRRGAPSGNSRYQKFFFDYIHYRSGLSTDD